MFCNFPILWGFYFSHRTTSKMRKEHSRWLSLIFHGQGDSDSPDPTSVSPAEALTKLSNKWNCVCAGENLYFFFLFCPSSDFLQPHSAFLTVPGKMTLTGYLLAKANIRFQMPKARSKMLLPELHLQAWLLTAKQRNLMACGESQRINGPIAWARNRSVHFPT